MLQGGHGRIAGLHQHHAEEDIDHDQEAQGDAPGQQQDRPEAHPPLRRRMAAPIGRKLAVGQPAHMFEGGIELGHHLVQAPLAVRHDAEAAFEPRRQTGVEELDQVGVLARPGQHVVHQLPETVAADVFLKELHHQAAAGPFSAVLAEARQVLNNIVHGGAEGVAGALALFLRIGRRHDGAVEGGDRGGGLGMELRQGHPGAAGTDAGHQGQQARGLGHHPVADSRLGRGPGNIIVRQLRLGGHGRIGEGIGRRGGAKAAAASEAAARRRGLGAEGIAAAKSSRRGRRGAGRAKAAAPARRGGRRGLVTQSRQGRGPEYRPVRIAVVASAAHRPALFTHQSSSFRFSQAPATCRPRDVAWAKSAQSGEARSSSK